MDSDDLEKLAFARAYPFSRPVGKTFLFNCETGDVEELSDWQSFLTDEMGVERTAVIACGSNASPQQLKRKFRGSEGVIPVVKAVLHDHDSVYCPLLASYGSVTATLATSPGALLDMHITYLTPGQLKIMNKTEGGYNLVRLKNIVLDVEGGSSLTSALAYLHKVGCLMSNGSPVALAEQLCSNRTFPALTQREAGDLTAKMLQLEPGDDFILSVIYKAKQRSSWTAKLCHSAVAYGGPMERIVECSQNASVITW